MHLLYLYSRFLRVYMKSQLEYRFSFFGDIFVNMLTYITLYLSFWILFNNFNNLNGWTYWEVVFLYNLNLLTYALSSMFFWAPMRNLELMVRTGEFDSFLIRPISPMLLLVFRQFQHTFLGHIIVSVVIFVLCSYKLHITWSWMNISFIVLNVVGGTLIQTGIIIGTASSTFWIVRSTTILDISLYTIRNYINYPISIYGKMIQLLLTFLLPYAFVNYYPSTVFLQKEPGLSWAMRFAYQYGSIAVGAVLLGLSLLVFRIGVMRYESSGS